MPRKAKKRTAQRASSQLAKNPKGTTDARPIKRGSKLVPLILLLAVVAVVRVTLLFSGGGAPPIPLPDEPLIVRPLADRIGDKAAGFELLTADQTGVDHVLPIDTSHPMKHLYFSATTGGGVAVGDVDNDGRPDLFFVNGPLKNRLYRQTSDFQFEDISVASGIAAEDDWGTGAAMVDVNNDGRLDIYVCNYDSPNQLYINKGSSKFVELAAEYRVDISDASIMPAFCDYDRDGDLDLYLLTYRFEPQHGHPTDPPYVERNGERMIKPEFQKYFKTTNDDWKYEPVGRADGLLRNNGDGTFTDVSKQANIRGLGHGLSATWWDYDDDGWPDLYVANDFMDPDQLYHNQRDGSFEDVTIDSLPHTSWYSMGSDFGDLDADGRMDLLVADMSATTHYKQKTSMGNMNKNRWFLENAIPRQYMRNALYLNTGTTRFQEAAYLAGLADSDWTWTVKLADLDNDGLLDVFFTNGSPRDFTNADTKFHGSMLIGRSNWDIYEDTPKREEVNLAFRNRGELNFQSVNKAWGLDHKGISMAAAHADLDNDGDLDLVVVNVDEPVSIYRNSGTDGNAVTVRLQGRRSNRFGLGATIKIKTEIGEQVRQLSPQTGFLASNQPLAHFGLGAADQIVRLSVHWPSGHVQSFNDIKVNSALTITEPAEEPTISTVSKSIPDQPAAALFQAANLIDAGHREQVFDDYALQPLLPYKLSQLGPGMAVADFDGDGHDDLFLGGAAGQSAQLWKHVDASLSVQQVSAFEADKECEDMGAVWFDVDVDGDLDLYVVSGGYELPKQSPLLQDRLYLNDGSGGFTRATDQLPALFECGSCVVAADYDRDGDVDLFVGSRVVPGEYPLAGASRVLRNDEGRLTDATTQLAPQLAAAGMITAAVWADVDDDGWQDLLLATEWGSIQCWRNSQGRLFVNETKRRGLAGRLGWWSSISAGDFDRDGDVDFVAGNFGLNTKYHASDHHPALLYYGDFDQTGNKRLIEAEFEDEILFPIRGKSCSTHAMPFLADKFETYHEFASASLSDIYTGPCLESATKLAANSFETVVLINEGDSFRFEPLPRTAQLAPTFGSVVGDFDGDGNLDLLLAQNFFSLQPETGRADGSLSQLLVGDGHGAFRVVSASESGIVVPTDAKSAVSIDVNADGIQDVVVASNDAVPTTLLSESRSPELRIKLVGKAGNPDAFGARVTVHFEGGQTATRYVTGGSGYLSQSSTILSFASPGRKVDRIEVRWPGGSTSNHQAATTGELQLLSHP